jgi:hypothetical protein
VRTRHTLDAIASTGRERRLGLGGEAIERVTVRDLEVAQGSVSVRK